MLFLHIFIKKKQLSQNCSFKETVAQDFWPPVVCINRPHIKKLFPGTRKRTDSNKDRDTGRDRDKEGIGTHVDTDSDREGIGTWTRTGTGKGQRNEQGQ